MHGIKAVLILAHLTCVLDVSSSFGATHQTISVTPATVDFGTQPINTTAHNTIVVENIGTHPVHIQSIVLNGSSAFRLRGWKGHIALKPSQGLPLTVTFRPTHQDSYSATVAISYGGHQRYVTRVDGMGAGGTAADLSISPTTAMVQAGKSQRFTASPFDTGASFGMTPRFSAASVEWLVNGTRGGSSLLGTISPSGLYTAPKHVSSRSWVTVSVANGTRQANAQITILPAPTPVSVLISPANASVEVGKFQQFTATVSGTSNTAVNWLVAGVLGGTSSVGTISATGLYTAASNVPTGPVTVTAQSASAPAATANATVTILQPPAPVSVTISPGSASVQVGQSLRFTAMVSGTTNTGVNWLVAGVVGGNSSAGTISFTGLYTAPSSVPTNPVTVTARSDFASASSANASVTITEAVHSVVLSWAASSSDVAGYNIYRSTVSGGPYIRLNSSLEPSTTYPDSGAQVGQIYYYVCTAVDSSGGESTYSDEVTAEIP